jgi:hypothetical protein
MVQGPQVDEGLRGLDAYEQMLNTFAENAKFFLAVVGPARRADGTRRRCLGGAATLVPAVAPAKLWRGESPLRHFSTLGCGPGEKEKPQHDHHRPNHRSGDLDSAVYGDSGRSC